MCRNNYMLSINFVIGVEWWVGLPSLKRSRQTILIIRPLWFTLLVRCISQNLMCRALLDVEKAFAGKNRPTLICLPKSRRSIGNKLSVVISDNMYSALM